MLNNSAYHSVKLGELCVHTCISTTVVLQRSGKIEEGLKKILEKRLEKGGKVNYSKLYQSPKSKKRHIHYKVNFMAQIPVIVDQNVFFPVKFRQEAYAGRVTGPYPVKRRPFFQQL